MIIFEYVIVLLLTIIAFATGNGNSIYMFAISWVVFSRLFIKSDKAYIILSVLIIGLVSGFRGLDVGHDTWNYSHIYQSMASYSWSELFSSFYADAIEIGYALMMKIISSLGGDYFVFQILQSLLFTALVGRFIYKNIEDKRWGLIFFLSCGIFLFSLNCARQALACAISINSIQYIKEKKWLSSIIICLLASTIHLSSVLFLIVPILYLIKEKDRLFIWMPIVIFVVSANALVFANTLISEVFSAYEGYADNMKGEVLSMGASSVMYIIIICLSLFVFYNKKTYSREVRLYSLLSILAVCCTFMGMQMNYLERLGMFFIMFEAVVIEQCYKISFKKIKTIMIRATESCFIIFYYMNYQVEQYIYNPFF